MSYNQDVIETSSADNNNNNGDQKFSFGQTQENYNSDSVYLNSYKELDVDVIDYTKEIFDAPLTRLKEYFVSLFPICSWILHYNLTWLYSDVIAGVTVGIVMVPQSMSYAQLAGLSAEYGLYSAFVGVFIYCFFATSKDVSIGPVAVMSMQVSKVIAHVQDKSGDKYSAPTIATVLAFICGVISLGLGLLRLGFILELISMPAVLAFMSGSAFSIIVGQIPGLMGYNKLVNTRVAAYEVVVNTLKHLPDTKVDAAFGLTCLFVLYSWKFICGYLIVRDQRRSRFWFYLQNLRHCFVIVFATLISWGCVYSYRKTHGADAKNPFSIIGKVPAGLEHTGLMTLPDGIIGDMAGEIPVSVIILLLEHISISKSFGRVNDYKIVPDQEMIAIGVTNLIGTFFNAYPATGSFSRSALKAKCGVRTPLAGIYTGACVLLALYCFEKAFYYIPKAALSAIIIHAVSDLIASWRTSYKVLKISPIDFGIFIVGLILTIFVSIETGIYFAIAASAAHLLWNLCIPNGAFLGRIQVAEVIDPVIVNNNNNNNNDNSSVSDSGPDSPVRKDGTGDDNSNISYEQDIEVYDTASTSKLKSSFFSIKNKITRNYNSTNQPVADEGSSSDELNDIIPKKASAEKNGDFDNTNKQLPREVRFHTRWVPIPKKQSPLSYSFVHTTRVNDRLHVSAPPPGVIVFRPTEAFVYSNSSKQYDQILDEIKRTTRRGESRTYKSKNDRPWNDPGELNLAYKWNSFLGLFSKKRREEVRAIDREYESEQKKVKDPRPLLRIVHLDFSTVNSTDVTSVQTLLDLKQAISLYTGKEVEFHFSGIVNPWIRRALVAAGFGKPSSSPDGSSSVVAEHKYFNIGTEYKYKTYGNENNDEENFVSHYEPLTGTDTPFFHLDIPSYSHLDTGVEEIYQQQNTY
ncbi:sulfate transmembrane transporter activity protein [[Candida] boidinii]|uniref:Unnamed protein product n=1 Tax=Candida boidinii TaxID=5477 RepID=A0ACB5TMA1_CANBO|nr:sulfate transmembrane transporter activity protein [[Candida] boidinii]OWB63216.1 sulfate transmembrane transporter activity protein [[Candida] boidinii]GME91519.1 unnamed protein product [[Candida] boidinii]